MLAVLFGSGYEGDLAVLHTGVAPEVTFGSISALKCDGPLTQLPPAVSATHLRMDVAPMNPDALLKLCQQDTAASRMALGSVTAKVRDFANWPLLPAPPSPQRLASRTNSLGFASIALENLQRMPRAWIRLVGWATFRREFARGHGTWRG